MAQKNGDVIRDIDISFGRWVMILLKVMFAAIPAVILFWLFWFFLTVVLAGLGLSLSNAPEIVLTTP